MDDKLKVLWNLDVLVKMCRSKSDGPSLRVEEAEIKNKIRGYQQEINEINSLSDDESYDTSAEMADRNIEIITKKQLQTLKSELKEKSKELNTLKEAEKKAYESTNVLRETKSSYEKYILSMQERVVSVTDNETIDRYNNLIDETSLKIDDIEEELKIDSKEYNDIQVNIINVTTEINILEENIDKKKKLLSETQANLENKDNYVDHSKKDNNLKKIKELEEKISTLNNRLEELQKDPKYIETKIKDIINSGETPDKAKNSLVDLINIVIRQPYINVPDDNKLEEELLRATQARDSFANEIDQKSYNILEANTPEKTRISFLEKRITNWQDELAELESKVELVDQDKNYEYKTNQREIASMIKEMRRDLEEFLKAYDSTPDSNISVKAGLKVSLDEKRNDIVEAEKIATQFRLDEAEDIEKASYTIKTECENIKNNIINAQKEISIMRNRLLTRKSGLIDITTRNKDKDILKDLAQTVIDLKHRRQFPDTPIDVIRRLEDELKINLTDSIDMDVIKETRELIPKDYDNYVSNKNNISTFESEPKAKKEKHGIKVITADEIENQEEFLDIAPEEELIEKPEKIINNQIKDQLINEIPENLSEEEPEVINEEIPEEEPLELNDEPTNENSNNLVNKSPMDIINENPFELNDVFTDGVIEPILAPEIHEDLENTVKESVQPMETEQIDDTETQNNDNI